MFRPKKTRMDLIAIKKLPSNEAKALSEILGFLGQRTNKTIESISTPVSRRYVRVVVPAPRLHTRHIDIFAIAGNDMEMYSIQNQREDELFVVRDVNNNLHCAMLKIHSVEGTATFILPPKDFWSCHEIDQ